MVLLASRYWSLDLLHVLPILAISYLAYFGVLSAFADKRRLLHSRFR